MSKIVREPNILYKIRNPQTGLYLAEKISSWDAVKSWNTIGHSYVRADKAKETIEHYVLVMGDLEVPLEVVRFKMIEESVRPVRVPVLEKVRTFIWARKGRSVNEKDVLWFAASPGTLKRLYLDSVMNGKVPRHVVEIKGHYKQELKELGITGLVEQPRNSPKTLAILYDDAEMVKLKLSPYFDFVVDVWDAEGNNVYSRY